MPPLPSNRAQVAREQHARETSGKTTVTAPASDTRGGTDVAPPDQLGDYVLGEELGRGGKGVVYKARQKSLHRIVALKVISSGPTASPEEVQRFQLEAKAAGRLDHPGIVPVFDVGAHGGRSFYSMAYVDGPTLAQVLKKAGGPLEPQRAARLVSQVCQAIHYAHQQGVLHRDIKPSNILLEGEETPRVADFGLAKTLDFDSQLTPLGQVMGTPSYMSPEQALGESDRIRAATDIYSLGALLYEFLTGRPPFGAASLGATLRQVILDDVVSPQALNSQVPRDLNTICLKCLEKDPARRFDSAEELGAELDRFLRGEPIRSRPITTTERLLKWSRRHRAATALIVVSALALAGLLIGGFWHQTRLQTELNRSGRLFTGGQALAEWVLFEHTADLARLPGNTEARGRLAERLLSYLDELSEDAKADLRLQADIASAYERVAQVQGDPHHFNLGRVEDALATYDKALAIRAQLRARRYPVALRAAVQHAKCRMARGGILFALKREDEALKEYRQCLQELQRLEKAHPRDRELALALAAIAGRLGSHLQQRFELDEALALHRESLRALASHAESADPRLLLPLATAHGRLGKILEQRGDLKAARREYERMREHVQDAVNQDQTDVVAKYTLSGALIAAGDMDTREGHTEDAIASYARAVALRRAIADADPNNRAARLSLATALERLAGGYELQKAFPKALEPLTELLEITRALYVLNRGDADLQRSLWIRLDAQGRARMRLGDLDGATRSFREALQTAERLVAEHPLRAQDRQGIAQGHDNLGTLQLLQLTPDSTPREQLEAFQAAIARFRASLKVFQELSQRGPLPPDAVKLQQAVERKRKLSQQEVQRLKAQLAREAGKTERRRNRE